MLAASCRFLRPAFFAVCLVGVIASVRGVHAGDNTWTNGSGNFFWDTTSLNWSGPGSIWNNGDGAIFSTTGAGTVNVPAGIFVNSFNFNSTSNYTFSGNDPFTLVNGTSTQTTGVLNVVAGATVTMNVPISSSVTAFQKIGGGVLELSKPVNLTASFPLTTSNSLSANLIIGVPFGQSPAGGTLRVLGSNVLSSNISVGLGGDGVLDIGANNVTIGQLIFTNQNQGLTYPNHGVIGTGTLRVTGEINVIGQGSLNGNNVIGTPLDLGAGTQIVRSTFITFTAGASNLMFLAPLSNGSLLKTTGFRENGIISNSDGIGLLANNTYMGSTVINGSANGLGSIATGTNASTSLKVYQNSFSLQGASGSFGSVTQVQVFSGGTLALDNNASFVGPAGIPTFGAAFNPDRLPDTAPVTLRDGGFTYRALSNVASTETIGPLSLSGGANTVTLAPVNAGSAALTVNGNLTLDPRSTMTISATSPVLGVTGQLKVNGTVPAASGGIIPRMVSTSDFVFYDATNGFSPLTTYSPTLANGANVALTGATAVPSSVAINALKVTTGLTTTIDPTAALTVNTGMMLALGTHTINGGTLDFGTMPGTFFGSHTISSAITGTQGLLVASGTTNLTGNLSGLSGTLSNIGASVLTLSGAAANYPGAIENRRGTLNINSNSAGGAITLGVAANDFNLLGTVPGLSISGAGAGAVINRDIIVDNGGNNAAGVSLLRSTFQPTISPLSNLTGSQTISGNITLNTSINVQGGGGGGTGATIFGGNITGPGTFMLSNGRANFTGDMSNAGGIIVSLSGFTGIANFQGTITGGTPILLNAGSNATTGISYSTQANIGTGPITVNAAGNPLPTIRILGTSSISNSINFPAVGTFVGGTNVDVAPTFTGTWTGPVTGAGSVNKTNSGTLVLTNSGNTYTGNTTVTAGTLALMGSGSFALSPVVTVGATAGPILDVTGVTGGANFDPSLVPGGSFALAFGQLLRGSGTVVGPTAVRTGSTLAPGNSIGTLTFDSNVTLDGTFRIETSATPAFDQLSMTGSANLLLTANSILDLPLSNTYDGVTPLTIVQLSSGSISGTFGSVLNLPNPYVVQYLGNSIVLNPVPEPSTLLLCGAATAAGWWYRRRGGKGGGND